MKGIKYKIIMPVFLFMIAVFFVLTFIGYAENKKLLMDNVELIARNKADKLVLHVDDKLGEWQRVMEVFALSNIVKDTVINMDMHRFRKNMSDRKNVFKEFENIFVADTNGIYVSLLNKSNITDRKYFHDVMTGKTVISDPMISKSTGNYTIVVAAPVKNNEGQIIGLVGATVNLSSITAMINNEKLGNTGYAYMIDSNGIMIAHPNKEYIYTYNILNSENNMISDIGKKMINKEEGVGYYEYEKSKKIVSYKPILSTGWSIAMTANYDEEAKSILILEKHTLSIKIIMTILLIMLLYYLTYTIVNPLNKLKNYMEIAISGNLDIQSDIRSNDEIGILSNSFNKLVKENKRLLEEADEYDKLKTEFFSNISHELKTPINIIFSAIQLLSLYTKNNNGMESEKINKNLDIMRQNCHRLLRLVNNLIDITEIDSGFMNINLKNKNIVEVIENITLSTTEYINSKSRTIIFDTDVEEKIIAFDQEKIERIMLNLISNAVKFTKPNDVIIITVWDKEEKVIISIKDTGIGIPIEKQEVIFERFRQVDPLLIRKSEGSGVGLSIVKSLVEMHRGKVYINSKYGEGTEVIIELPAVDTIQENIYINSDEDFKNNSDVEKIRIEFSDIY